MARKMWINKEEFEERTAKRDVRISVVGLGYVGLNLSCLFAKERFPVYGFDIDRDKIDKLKRGLNPIPEEEWLDQHISKLICSTDNESAAKCGDVIFIAVPTPCRDGETCLDHLESATKNVSKNFHFGKILVVESTVPPGTTEGFVGRIIKKETGLTPGADFGLVFSPERIDPGNKRNMIWNTPKVVGGIDVLSTRVVSHLYSQVVEKVVTVSNPRTAELVKVVENTQRDVNIALTNLLAKTADKLDIDVKETLEAASTKWNFLRLTPGCGVGGECIGDSANMLVQVMNMHDVDSNLVLEARKINESMPDFTVDRLRETVGKIGISMNSCKIGIFGLSYKRNSSDLRNSPSLKIIGRLRKNHCRDIVAYDPFVNIELDLDIQQTRSFGKAMKGRDCIIVATDHDEFRNMDVNEFSRHNIRAIIDGKNCLEKDEIESLGIYYRGIGR